MGTAPLVSILYNAIFVFTAILTAAMNPNTTNTFDESIGGMAPIQQVNETAEGITSVHQIQPGPERYPRNTGGLPPKIQLPGRARRKSEVVAGETEKIEPYSYTPEQLTQMQYMVYEQRPFTDHTGKRGLSIFRGLVKKDQKPLLSPWNWQIYVTYGATAADCGSVPLDFYTSIIEQLSYQTHQYFRFDFLFLPGANQAACVRHYRREKQFRAGGELALIPTYGDVLNTLIILDRKDWKSEGVLFFEFDKEEDGEQSPEAEVPESFNKPMRRSRAMKKPYIPGTAWVGEEMSDTYIASRIRQEWEKEYLLARELMEV